MKLYKEIEIRKDEAKDDMKALRMIHRNGDLRWEINGKEGDFIASVEPSSASKICKAFYDKVYSRAAHASERWTYVPAKTNSGRASCGKIKQGNKVIAWIEGECNGKALEAAHNAILQRPTPATDASDMDDLPETGFYDVSNPAHASEPPQSRGEQGAGARLLAETLVDSQYFPRVTQSERNAAVNGLTKIIAALLQPRKSTHNNMRTLQVNGRTLTVYSDATDDEIRQALSPSKEHRDHVELMVRIRGALKRWTSRYAGSDHAKKAVVESELLIQGIDEWMLRQ